MAVLKETIIPAVQGVTIGLHVFAPSVKYRTQNPDSLVPTVCVRYSDAGFRGMRLYEKVEMMGPSTLKMLNVPLSGTSGRAQVILLTDHDLKVWSYLDNPPLISTTLTNNMMEVFKDVIAQYDLTQHYQCKRILQERNKAINKNKKTERPLKANR